MSSAEEQGLRYGQILGGLLAATWLAALVVAIGPGGPLQVICGLPLVLALPGTLAAYALLPAGREIDGSLRAVLSFALSVVAALAVGLFLALCFDEVSRAGAALGLAAVGTAAGIVARARAGAGETISIPAALPLPVPVLVVSALLLVACATLAVAALNVSNLPGHFTALTLTESSDGARIEVRSHEGDSTRYRYIVRDGDERSLRAGTIELDGGGIRTVDLAVPADTHVISVALYTDGNRPYRQVTLRGLK